MKIGQRVKKIYYKHKLIGSLPAAALTIFDFYLNNKLRLGYAQRPYPIAQAHLALICLVLYRKTGNQAYLDKARGALQWLSENYSRNYSGYCWGINMPWVSKIATYAEDTPHVTHTPYALEALLDFRSTTNCREFDHIIDSVLNFLDFNLNKMIDEEAVLALSYSPKPETRIVVNANSYAMLCYALLYKKNQPADDVIKRKILRLYNFLVNARNADGSWYYFADAKPGNFIDCFHSCFVLKNIYKVNQIVPLPGSEQIIRQGYDYLKQYFWNDAKKLFRRFSQTDRLSLVRFDLYDNAEMLSLAIMLGDKDLADMLANSIARHFVIGTDIYSHIIFPNRRINKNTMRWAGFPYLYALAKTI
ncbi:MAG TPA: hypothetical protein VG890_09255, partial [Puia sp.]|nr:hypothetical protein [Puia sp.]